MDANQQITIDGRMGEGGGQVLRSSLALSLLTGRPVRIHDIRAGRRKGGLMRQHLACVRAAMEISGAGAQGVSLGSSELTIAPGPVRSGSYKFSVGSAGSAALVLQTVLMPLLLADGVSELRIEGGTHNAWAPPFDFLELSFLPLLQQMGARVEIEMERVGFYPAGGGVLRVRIEPVSENLEALQPLELLERGEQGRPYALIRRAHLPVNVCDREWESLRRVLHWSSGQRRDMNHDESAGPGNSVHLVLPFENVTEVVSSFGAKQRGAKAVSSQAAKEAQQFLKWKPPVGPYLADQLLLPIVLLKGGVFQTQRLSQHTQTNIDVIHKFLPDRIQTEEISPGVWQVRV